MRLFNSANCSAKRRNQSANRSCSNRRFRHYLLSDVDLVMSTLATRLLAEESLAGYHAPNSEVVPDRPKMHRDSRQSPEESNPPRVQHEEPRSRTEGRFRQRFVGLSKDERAADSALFAEALERAQRIATGALARGECPVQASISHPVRYEKYIPRAEHTGRAPSIPPLREIVEVVIRADSRCRCSLCRS